MKLHRPLVALTILAALTATACSKKSTTDDRAAAHPAKVEHVTGSDSATITLTDKAIERIGLETSTMHSAPTDAGGAAGMLALSNAAVLYDASGRTWAYVSTARGTYVRTPITVETFNADDALLSAGPPVGTVVVTTGAAELFGAESTFGED
jgi:hypothetical protein